MEKSIYSADEIKDLHAKGHHIGKPDQPLHATENDGAKKGELDKQKSESGKDEAAKAAAKAGKI